MKLVLCLAFGLGNVVGYGGWGPGEDYGHAGSRPPRENPNAAYGYDHANILGGRFNYSAIVLRGELPAHMRDPRFTSFTPMVMPPRREAPVRFSTSNRSNSNRRPNVQPPIYREFLTSETSSRPKVFRGTKKKHPVTSRKPLHPRKVNNLTPSPQRPFRRSKQKLTTPTSTSRRVKQKNLNGGRPQLEVKQKDMTSRRPPLRNSLTSRRPPIKVRHNSQTSRRPPNEFKQKSLTSRRPPIKVKNNDLTVRRPPFQTKPQRSKVREQPRNLRHKKGRLTPLDLWQMNGTNRKVVFRDLRK